MASMSTTGADIGILEQCVGQALAAVGGGAEPVPEEQALRDLSVRARKLARAWDRPQCLGFFGPSQAGKSFLVGALLAHELGTLDVRCGGRSVDFLKEINPAKGVESTGVVTRFSTGAARAHLRKGGFACQLLSLEGVVESMATGFLVECTSPAVDPDKVERCLRDARLQAGPAAPPAYRAAWDAVWHSLQKKYQDRHPYLNELKRQAPLRGDAWKQGLQTIAGWQHVFSLLWGGPGYAPDLEQILRLLCTGLDALGYAEYVEVDVADVRASQGGASIIDAACLNALGADRSHVRVTVCADGREVSVPPGVLAGLIAEIRLELAPVKGSLFERADLLDFPGGRALKGINGFGAAELAAGKLENSVEVYKRGKLTFLFEQYALEREITTLVLCSPGPTKPEAVQLQSQVESWLRIRYGSPTPTQAQEIEVPSLFVALTKFDMSLGALRSDNAKDRWESRVQEACVDFWARSPSSWVHNWGGKGQPFSNMFWVRNPYADQMQSLKPGEPDFESVKRGYGEARAVRRHIKDAEAKWAAVEGQDDRNLPKSGVPLLASALRTKLEDDVKAKELAAEAAHVLAELLGVLKALTPSRDEAEERERVLEAAKALTDAVEREMSRTCSGAPFGALFERLSIEEDDLEAEVRKAHAQVAPMSIKTSDKVKKVIVHVLKWWTQEASRRYRESELAVPPALVDQLLREVCTSKQIMPVLGNALYPYFSRTTLDTKLVARVFRVKVTDTLLLAGEERATPKIPVRLSYAEDAGADAPGDAIDWGNVDFESDGTDAPAAGVEIIFAGRRAFGRWRGGLGDFYLKNRGEKTRAAPNDPRTQALANVLREVEKVHVGPEA